MKPDPMETVDRVTSQWPPARGPGSGKAAWVEFARDMAQSNGALWDMVDRQSGTIRELQAEIELLRKQIETRKPKGGKPRIDDAKRARIEAELEAGYSKRSIAARHRVSAMTVVRVAQRVAARDAVLS